MPRIAPRIVRGDDYHFQQCYAARWDFNLSHKDTPGHVLVAYRSQFTALRPEEFIRRPYEDVVGELPPYCREGQHIWAHCSWTIFWNMVEPHPVHRVSRQLGFYQTIPTDHLFMTPDAHLKLYKIKKTGSHETNWATKHNEFIAYWNGRNDNLFNGVHVPTTSRAIDNNYMQWYFDKTVLFITNPGNAGPSNSYRDWGGQAQAYAEGFRHIHERVRQTMDDQGRSSSQSLQEFQQIPQYMMNLGGDVERMNYGSQQIQFPAPDYYPQQPDNYYSQQPDNQLHTHQHGPPDYDLVVSPGFEQPHSTFESYYDSGHNIHETNFGSNFADEIFRTSTPSQQNYFGGSSNFAPSNQYNQYGGEMMDLTPVHMSNLSDFSSGWDSPALTEPAEQEDNVPEQQQPKQSPHQRGQRRERALGKRQIHPPDCGAHGKKHM